MKPILAVSSILGLALAGIASRAPAVAGDDYVKPAPSQHDVAVRMRVRSQKGTSVRAQLVVQNKGRKSESQVVVSVFADAPVGTPLWTGTMAQLKAHRKRTTKAEFEVPAGTGALVAVAHGEESDDNPGNNLSAEHIEHEGDDDDDEGGQSGSGSGTGTTNGYAIAGAATYSTNCASCHGADAKGGTSGEKLLGESARSLLEAIREGEDGMPKFPNLTSTDCQNMAAFLKDPSAATIPTPPPPPPPSGTAPTYAGQIKSILDSNCASCHQGTFAPKGVVLNTYAGASAAATASLAAMQGGTMPPSGALSSTLINTFQDWINGGKQQ